MRALPFASMVYGPARLFVHPDMDFLSDLVLRQGAAIAIFALAVALVYRAGVRRIHSNGG